MVEAELVRDGIAFKVADARSRAVRLIAQAQPHTVIAVGVACVTQTLVEAVHLDGCPVVAACHGEDGAARIGDLRNFRFRIGLRIGIGNNFFIAGNIPVGAFVTEHRVYIVVAGLIVAFTSAGTVVGGVLVRCRLVVGFLSDLKRDVAEALVKHAHFEFGARISVVRAAGCCKADVHKIVERRFCSGLGIEFELDVVLSVGAESVGDIDHVAGTVPLDLHDEVTVALERLGEDGTAA